MFNSAEELNGPYDVELIEDVVDGVSVWTALHPALIGCNAAGRSQDEALANLEEARDAWIATARHLRRSPPEPGETMNVAVQYATTPGQPRTRERNVGSENPEVLVFRPRAQV